MIKKLTLLSVLTGCFCQLLMARIIDVPSDLYPDIQGGIDSSYSGDTIIVAEGRYYENINFRGRNIVVASLYLIDNDTSHIVNTIIDGSNPSQPDSASCVRIVSGEDSSSVLAGFTLTGGRGTKWRDIHNALLYREGGGILIELSSPTIRNNVIVDNQATDRTGVRSAGGGGIRIGDGNPLIENNVIIQNRGRYGAGIVLNYATGRIENNIIWGNSGGEDYGGGGIWAFAVGPSIIINNTIVNNSSARGGGGLEIWQTSAVGRNNIIWDNHSVYDSAQIELSNGTAEMTYNDIQYGWDGEGNIDADPSFEGMNFYLSSGSPCIDGGNPDGIYDDPQDSSRPGFALWPSQGTIRNDMGVYGGPYRTLLPSRGSYVEIEGDSQILPISEGFSNYPNPFNARTSIEYNLDKAGRIEISVYNLLGRRMAVLYSGVSEAGRHAVIWDASGCPSGIYFARLENKGMSRTLKMALLK